ncbi:MAG: TIR domain-containing protein, partial [Clostridia bacterium]|nr:TIR domain-containing protein [Clostridia bacterium]
MAVLECKICGGLNEMPQGVALMPCKYCGSQMTLPLMKDENHAAAFNRGNHFRRIGEFDKALAVYERIVQEDETNAEAHWCCALCRFGIEYVQDPASGEYLPTCHRASFDSFLEDVDYLAAVEHADENARRQYQQDAEKIAEVLHGILATCRQEQPFDVFICYKETDKSGQRTHDSQLAQDIYYQLTDQGLRVFFARITLEDKAGTQYEPYIFAALNSAKVMVVVGTDPAHMNAVWVRNEWSRFLAIMKRDRTRLLIPCYRGMDPYDMPEQLSVLQGYDMSRIGFIQDLVRGIRKVVGVEEKPAAAPQPAAPAPQPAPAQSASPATDPLLRRVALFLEDGDWHSADEYC